MPSFYNTPDIGTVELTFCQLCIITTQVCLQTLTLRRCNILVINNRITYCPPRLPVINICLIELLWKYVHGEYWKFKFIARVINLQIIFITNLRKLVASIVRKKSSIYYFAATRIENVIPNEYTTTLRRPTLIMGYCLPHYFLFDLTWPNPKLILSYLTTMMQMLAKFGCWQN